MSELPKGWTRGSLGDVLQIRNGYAFKSTEFKQHGVPLVRQSNLDGDKVDLSKCAYLEERYLLERAGFTLHNGDVLIGMSGSVGKLCTYNKNFAALQNQRVGKIELHAANQTEWRLIWHFLKTITGALLEKSKGVAVANVSPDDIHSLPLNIPPLAEQTRIAAKLDELLAQVDTLKARIDGIPVLLNRFRQSVLAAAVSGRLTRESYDSLSGTYALEPLGMLVAEPLRNGKSVKDGIGQRVLRLSALKKNSIDYFESKAGNWAGINFEQYIVKNDDFLISRGNGTKAFVGRGGLARNVTDNIAYPDTMIRVRPNTQKLLPKYLATVWNSQLVRRQIESTARTTAGIWKISQGDLEVVKIPLPSLVEQSEIVRSVEQLFAYADQLEIKIASAKSRIDHLTQSILTKAFRGELVPQDPNDEPASVLLERINAQRVATPKAKRGRRVATPS
ncbi:restriction endonuclease subunit S [Pseudomonas canadensis]|uniref:restriction endonuclease subunit S n=1 Tax=Pseudomonas canadensis TaxID=915099 RepID=UPI0030D55656